MARASGSCLASRSATSPWRIWPTNGTRPGAGRLDLLAGQGERHRLLLGLAFGVGTQESGGLPLHHTRIVVKGTFPLTFGVRPDCRASAQLASPQRGTSDRSDQMRIRALVVALAVAAPLLAVESRPAAACDWFRGSTYGYAAPPSYSYAPRTYGYAPSYSYYGSSYYGSAPSYSYYGSAPLYRGYGFYGRRLGWRGSGYRGYRGYGYRGIGVGRVGVGRVGVGRVGIGRVGVGRIGRR